MIGAMGLLTFTAYETISSGVTIVEDIREDVHTSVERLQDSFSNKLEKASQDIESFNVDFKQAREELSNSFRD